MSEGKEITVLSLYGNHISTIDIRYYERMARMYAYAESPLAEGVFLEYGGKRIQIDEGTCGYYQKVLDFVNNVERKKKLEAI